MSDALQCDFAPAYELEVSLWAYVQRQHHKSIDLGTEWVRQVTEALPPSLRKRLSDPAVRKQFGELGLIALYILLCPVERTADGFLRWFSSLQPGELYELLMPFGSQAVESAHGDFLGMQEQWATLLAEWNDAYFRHVDASIVQGLTVERDRIRQLADEMTANKLVTQATNGLKFASHSGSKRIVLVPQHHFAPWNLIEDVGSTAIYLYPADVLPIQAGDPPKPLVRLARALSDESRLRILYHLGNGPQTFTDIVKHSGLTKGTVHHHMVALRAAGLVYTYVTDTANSTYELNSSALQHMSDRFEQFLLRDNGLSQGGSP